LRKLHHQLLAGESLLGVVLCGTRDDDAEPGGFREPARADDQCEVRPGKLMSGRGGEIQMHQIATFRVIGLLAQRSSLPLRSGIKSGPAIPGLMFFSSSFSVHFFRGFIGWMVIVSPRTRTRTDCPSLSLS